MNGMNKLFGEGAAPRYAQIAEIFRRRISRGLWPAGMRMPSNDELAHSFGVARVTIRQALTLLAQEKLIDARQGRGTFVTGTVESNRWLKVETTLANLAEVYRDTDPELLNLEESIGAAPLKPGDGKPAPEYFYMRRVHSRAGRAYCVISIYLDSRIFHEAPDAFRKQTVIPLLVSMTPRRIARARQTLSIGIADMEAARHLGISVNAPVAEVRRVFNSSNGTAIYLAEVTYRGDVVQVEMDLKP